MKDKHARKFSLVQRLFLPFFGIESNERIVVLHLHPAHFIGHIHPSLLLEELGGTELRTVVGHVVEHIEQDGIREDFDG